MSVYARDESTSAAALASDPSAALRAVVDPLRDAASPAPEHLFDGWTRHLELVTEPPATAHVAGVRVLALSTAGAVDHLASLAARAVRPHLFFTMNVDQLISVRRVAGMRDAYAHASGVFTDGWPVVWLSRKVGTGVPERVTGADLMPQLCAEAAERGLRVAIVGGAPGVPELAASNLRQASPALRIVAAESPPLGFENDAEATQDLLERLRQSRPDIVFLCVGSPKAELWANAHADQLPNAVVLAAGAAVDFAAGRIERAPEVWQRRGMEWAWRLVHDWRRLWRRYLLRDSAFALIAVRELIRSRVARRSAATS